MKKLFYHQWFAENLGLGIPIDHLAASLPEHLQSLVRAWEKEWLAHPIRTLHHHWRAQEGTINQIFRLMTQSQWTEKTIKIPHVKTISSQNFFKTYYQQNRPLILTGLLKDWSLFRHWSPQFLKKHWGTLAVRCQRRADIKPCNIQHPERVARIRSFSKALHDFETDHPQGSFIVANNFLLQQPGFEGLFDGIGPLPDWLAGGNRRNQTHWWMGPSGTITPWHHDALNILICQVWGMKKIRLVPATEWVWMENTQGVFSDRPPGGRAGNPHPLSIEIVLQPGQALFLPVGWWHEVEALCPSLSLALTHFAFPNEYEWTDPTRCEYKSKRKENP